MRRTRSLLLLPAVFLLQTALADAPLSGTPSPLAELQHQIDTLASRVETLESNAPNPSVEGRSYCFVLHLMILRGNSLSETESLQTRLIRRSATFSGGTLTADFLSHVFNEQQDDGIVTNALGTQTNQLIATYTQTEKKLDIQFEDASVANWYTSNDGSVIVGSRIEHGTFGPGGVVTIGFLRNWTLVETDDPGTCDAEGQ